jgi:hypothetical protein
MARQFNLAQLDAYANSISTYQTHLLYENKMHKKYKPLNEAFEPDADDYFRAFISNAALAAHGQKPTDIVLSIATNRDYIKYKATNYGIWFYVVIPDDYKELLGLLKDLGYTNDDVEYVDDNYQQYL